MTKTIGKRFFLYLFFIIGIGLIVWSLIIIGDNYGKQKQLAINNSLHRITKSENTFQNNISSVIKTGIYNLQSIASGIVVREYLLNRETRPCYQTRLENFLKNSRLHIVSLYLTDKRGNIIYSFSNIPDTITDKKAFITGSNDYIRCVQTNEIADSIFIDSNYIIHHFISTPVFIKDTISGYLRMVRMVNYLNKLIDNYMTDEYSSAIINKKTGETIIKNIKSSLINDDSLYFVDANKYFKDESIILENENGYKILTKTKLKFISGSYYLLSIHTPVKEWKRLQNLFENLVYSVILIVMGISFFFVVIIYSRNKYNKLNRENKVLEESAIAKKKYEELFNNSFLPTAIVQNDKLVLVNKAGLDFLEAASIDEIAGKEAMDFVHPDDREGINRRMKDFKEGINDFITRQRKFVTLKGNIKTAEIAAYTTEFNEKPAIQIMISDVTERQVFIEKLKESELKYRTIFEKLNDAVLLIKDGYFVDCNESAVSIYGFTKKEELLGLHPGNLSPEKQPDGRKSLDKANEMIFKALTEGFNRFDWQHKRPDGSLFWMDVTLTSITMDGEQYVHVIGRDITDLKRMYEQLEENKNYLYSIIKRLPIPILVYSDTDEITFINNSFSEVLQFNKEDIPDTESWWILTIKDSRKRNELKENWEKAVSKMKRDNDVVEQQWVIHTKDNKEKTCEFFAIRIKGEILVVINDISEVVLLNHELLAAKEKAQESNRLKSAFLANLSHELRTPMNGILGFSQLLVADDLSDEERLNYVEIIRQSGNRLLSMINDIINISKIDANQIEIYTESVPLLPIISEIVEFYKFEAKAKNIDFLFESVNLSKDIYVHTDESKLKQIFANIIGNAIKYTPEGEVVVSTNVYKDYIEIIVTDTGYGIKEEKQQQIFDRFVRLEETSDKTDGTGLGLAISRAYAKRLGIKIFVKSKFGVGSEFIIQIPMESDKPKVISKSETIKDVGDYDIPDLTGKNILIAEDEELNYMILKLYIENTNANIYRAENGKKAVEIVAKNRIDFVFMDIKMPVMDGMEAMKIIKKAFPSIPVVAQTAYTFSEDKDKALAQGFNDYLSKPLAKKTVIEILRKYFFSEVGETVV